MSKDNEKTPAQKFTDYMNAGRSKNAGDYDYDFDHAARIQEMQRERLKIDAACSQLEEQFAERGLKFTQNFGGAMPVQAFGVIDGMRFYFRFRHDVAALRVGELDPEKPVRDYDRAVAGRMERIRKADALLQAGEITQEQHASDLKWFGREPRIEYPNGRDDYPTLIKKESRIYNVLNQEYAGILSADEAVKVFAGLVESLEEVDYDLNAPTA